MNILILGAGNMGSALTKQLTRAGHAVSIAARHPGKAQAVAAAHPGAKAVAAAGDALPGSDLVIVATHYADAAPALRTLGPLAGKIVIDITNPLTADYMGLTVGHSTSAAEEIARAIPDAHVIKAFNTLFAQVLSDGPAFADGQVAPVFFAGDDADAKRTVRTLIESIGFQPIDVGGLRNARYLEPLAGLSVYLAYGAGVGNVIAPTFISRTATRAGAEQEQKNLANFDDLDFNVYSNQRWDEFSHSHAPDIVVHWPDGRTTTGIEPHIADLKQQFVFAPDTHIKKHPIRIAQGDWTAVQGVMEGTFSQPMPVGGGKSIPPTNKPFRIDMVTIGRWENDVMKEEWLLWDNQAFMKQIGLMQ